MILSLHPGSGHMTENFPSANPVPSSLTNAAGRSLKLSCAAPGGQCTLTNVNHGSTPWTLQLLKPTFRCCHCLERIEGCPRLFMPSFHPCIARFLLHDLTDIDLSPNLSAKASQPSYKKMRTHRPDDEHVEQPQLLQHRETFTIFSIPAGKPQLSPCVKKQKHGGRLPWVEQIGVPHHPHIHGWNMPRDKLFKWDKLQRLDPLFKP